MLGIDKTSNGYDKIQRQVLSWSLTLPNTIVRRTTPDHIIVESHVPDLHYLGHGETGLRELS
jgi:hypothetical protein